MKRSATKTPALSCGRDLSKQQPQHRAIADMAGGRVKQKLRLSWVTVCAAIHGPVAYFQRYSGQGVGKEWAKC